MDAHRRSGRDLTLVSRTHAWLSVLVVVLSGALLVGAPVSVRAGSPIAHAHTLPQVLADAADGRLDHHAPHPLTLGFSWDAGPLRITSAMSTSALPILADTLRVDSADNVAISLTSIAAVVALLIITGDPRKVRRGEWHPVTLQTPWFAVADDPPPRLSIA